MSCDTNFELLMAYLDGDLSPLERGRLAEHIVGCEACRSTVNDLRAVSGALTKWAAPEPQSLPTATELLERAGFAPAVPVEPSPWREAIRRWGAVAALVAVAGLVGVYAIGNYSLQDEQQVAKSDQPLEAGRPPDAGSASPATSTTAPTNEKPNPSAPTSSGIVSTEAPSAPENRTPSDSMDDTADGAKAAPAAPVTAADQQPAIQESRAKTAEPAGAPPPPPATEEAESDSKADRPLAATRQPAPKPAAAATGAGESVPPARTEKKTKDERSDSQYIKTGVLELEVRSLDDIARAIEAEARSAGGRASRGAEVHRGDETRVAITVSIPTDRFDGVFERLRGLGTVRNQMRSNKDVTASLDQIDRELDKQRDADEASASRLRNRRQGLVNSTQTGTIRVTLVRSE